jgi:hypothetical protein
MVLLLLWKRETEKHQSPVYHEFKGLHHVGLDLLHSFTRREPITRNGAEENMRALHCKATRHGCGLAKIQLTC